jgi:1-phosphofructokinase family hexose kinase
MTYILCPNLAVDRVLEVDAVQPGGTMRCRALNEQAGGKGANVARALRALGGAQLLAGFAAGHNGRLIAELADDEGLEIELVAVDGEARVSTVVLAADGPPTRLFEHGPDVDGAAERALVAAAGARPAQPGEWAIVDGAAPPGSSDGFYGALCSSLRAAGYRVMVDATGAQLSGTLRERPDFVKVNLEEACSAVGAPAAGASAPAAAVPSPSADPDAPDEGRSGAAGTEGLAAAGLELSRRLVAAGAGGAVVTLGPAGAAGLIDGGEWLVRTPPVQAVNTVGSGDCFAAGLLLGFERGDAIEAALRAAAGAAAANAASPLTGHFDLALARDLAAGAVVDATAAE